MKGLLKRLGYALLPQWTTAVQSARARAHSQRYLAGIGCSTINPLLVAKLGNKVLSGPFQGLELTPMTYAEQIGPYLLGTYESEIRPAWELLFKSTYSQIIDIGAKFGFYAVGLALRYPQSSVVAFDTDWWARKAVSELAKANRVKNVQIKGFCTSEWLAKHTLPNSLIISDCEGYEATLFTPASIDALKHSSLLIETHDNFVPAVTEQLQQLFSKTHDVTTYGVTLVQRQSPVDLEFIPKELRGLALHEVRDEHLWLLCQPKKI
jgi:precorrin-6B methylase 2